MCGITCKGAILQVHVWGFKPTQNFMSLSIFSQSKFTLSNIEVLAAPPGSRTVFWQMSFFGSHAPKVWKISPTGKGSKWQKLAKLASDSVHLSSQGCQGSRCLRAMSPPASAACQIKCIGGGPTGAFGPKGSLANLALDVSKNVLPKRWTWAPNEPYPWGYGGCLQKSETTNCCYEVLRLHVVPILVPSLCASVWPPNAFGPDTGFLRSTKNLIKMKAFPILRVGKSAFSI